MSREKILKAIRQNKPEGNPLPEPPDFMVPVDDLKAAFTLVSESSGTTVVDGNAVPLNEIVGKLFPAAEVVFSTVESIPTHGLDGVDIADPHAIENVDLAIFKGELGVAENGAIWLGEDALVNRVSAFIAQHLIILLDPGKLVWNMHQAYAQIKVNENGYGVFIAGPSKTADIEQSLVIGAQGARSLTVIWI